MMAASFQYPELIKQYANAEPTCVTAVESSYNSPGSNELLHLEPFDDTEIALRSSDQENLCYAPKYSLGVQQNHDALVPCWSCSNGHELGPDVLQCKP